jgi:hypothetical protein
MPRLGVTLSAQSSLQHGRGNDAERLAPFSFVAWSATSVPRMQRLIDNTNAICAVGP